MPYYTPLIHRLWAELYEIRPVTMETGASVHRAGKAAKRDVAANKRVAAGQEEEEEHDDEGAGISISRQWIALSRDVVPVNITCVSADENRTSGDVQVGIASYSDFDILMDRLHYSLRHARVLHDHR